MSKRKRKRNSPSNAILTAIVSPDGKFPPDTQSTPPSRHEKVLGIVYAEKSKEWQTFSVVIVEQGECELVKRSEIKCQVENRRKKTKCLHSTI